MNTAMEYLIKCANRGDFQEFLKEHAKFKKCIYKGNNDLDLHFRNGKIIKITHAGIELKVVNL